MITDRGKQVLLVVRAGPHAPTVCIRFSLSFYDFF